LYTNSIDGKIMVNKNAADQTPSKTAKNCEMCEKQLLTGDEQWGYRSPVEDWKFKFKMVKIRLEHEALLEKLRKLEYE